MKSKDELDDELCGYCPIPKDQREYMTSSGTYYCCEGVKCNEAYENYKEENNNAR